MLLIESHCSGRSGTGHSCTGDSNQLAKQTTLTIMKNCTLTSIELFEQLDKNLLGFAEWTNQEICLIKQLLGGRSKVLDIGCGWGREIVGIASECEMVIGIDIDAVELENAKDYLGQTHKVSLSQQNAKHTAFPDRTFDVIICVGNTFGNLANDKEGILREMIRLVKADGRLFISVFAKEAIKERTVAYSNIGLEILEVTAGKIHFSDGYISEAFEEKQLQRLFEQYGLESEITKVGPVGLCATLKRR